MPIVWCSRREIAVRKCKPWIEKTLDNVGLTVDMLKLSINILAWIEDGAALPTYIDNYIQLTQLIVKVINHYSTTLRGRTREHDDLISVLEELERSIDAVEE